MSTVRDVMDALEQIAPARFAYADDRIGLQLGDPAAEVRRVAVSLDPSLEAARFARESDAQMLVCHHPLIWNPLPHLRYDSHKGRVVRELVEGGIAFVAAHTNWDCAPGGVNDVLAELIGLSDVSAFGSSTPRDLFKVVVTTPTGTEDGLIDAMASAGAGAIGLYERCSWKTEGSGSFRALEGADPTLGSVGELETVQEMRIEMVCPAESVEDVRRALVEAHTYEEPAYDFYPLRSSPGQQIGRIGSLPSPMSPEQFRAHLDKALDTHTLLCSKPDRKIKKVGVVGGAAADEWMNAQRAGADAFVTGEVPHHVMVDASESGIAIAASGHYATENPGIIRLGERLGEEIADVEIVPYRPKRGTSGRPL